MQTTILKSKLGKFTELQEYDSSLGNAYFGNPNLLTMQMPVRVDVHQYFYPPQPPEVAGGDRLTCNESKITPCQN